MCPQKLIDEWHPPAYATRPRGPPHGAGSAKKRRGAAAARETKAPHAVTADL